MTRIWQLGNGQTLNDALIPYQYGTDEYYRYIADKRRAASGDTGPQKSDALTKLEQGLQQDKLAPVESQREQWWQDAHNANQAEYAKELQAYNEQVQLWKQGGNDFVKGMDHGVQAADGYEYVNPALQSPGLVGTAEALGHWQAKDPYFKGAGKMGGAGNENPASGVDNSWNDLDGTDVRTDEQKYYDRNLKNVHQTADANGTYHWYGTEVGYDPKNAAATRDVDLTQLGSRPASPEGVDAGKQASGGAFDGGKVYDYNNVNGYGISYTDYLDQTRKRANLSTWGRTS